MHCASVDVKADVRNFKLHLFIVKTGKYDTRQNCINNVPTLGQC